MLAWRRDSEIVVAASRHNHDIGKCSCMSGKVKPPLALAGPPPVWAAAVSHRLPSASGSPTNWE
jgi:hypothetical protein